MKYTLETLSAEVARLKRDIADMQRRVPVAIRMTPGGGGGGSFSWFQADTRANLQTPTAGQIPALGYTTSNKKYWVYVDAMTYPVVPAAGWVCISHTYVVVE